MVSMMTAAQTFAAPSWGPWPSSRSPKALGHHQLAGRLFDYYQKYVSSDDGAACPFYPTCSAYAYQAVTKHGFFYGSLLAIDRLFSEYPGMPKSGLYPLITKYGIHRPYDPVP